MITSTPMFPSLARSGTAHQIPSGMPLTPQGIMTIVQRIAARAGSPSDGSDPKFMALATLKCHDLRRSCAQMAKDGGAELDTIKHMLGHSSMVTTERYLNGIQDLRLGRTAPDRIKVKIQNLNGQKRRKQDDNV